MAFLNVFYGRYQENSIERIAANIKNSDGDLVQLLEEIAYKNNICMEYVANNGLAISFNTRISNCIFRNASPAVMSYKADFINSDVLEKGARLVDPVTGQKTLLYVVKVANGHVFINAPLEDANATSNLLRGQLIYITLLSIMLSCLIAYFLSKRITRPITNITKEAKKIGDGEHGIRYQKQGILEIDELVETLNTAQDEIEKMDMYRKDLLANVGHDLKTPLTMIKAYTEMVRDFSYKDKKKEKEHLDIIIQETDRLNLLVNDVLDLSKLQAVVEKLNLEEFDLVDEINTIIKRYEIVKETEDYKFKIKAPKSAIVLADKNKIAQVIYNLVNNAINYTGSDKMVTIKVSEEKEVYLVEIVDSGKGIKPDEIDYIWDKYYKSDKTHARNVIGTGIGLSIVKEILVNHKFLYGVETKQNKGTTFWFRIDKK